MTIVGAPVTAGVHFFCDNGKRNAIMQHCCRDTKTKNSLLPLNVSFTPNQLSHI